MEMLNWHTPLPSPYGIKDHRMNLIRCALIALVVGLSATACERPQSICGRQDLQQEVLGLLHREAFEAAFGEGDGLRSSLDKHFKLTMSLGLLRLDQVRFVSVDSKSEVVTCGGTVHVANPHLDREGRRVTDWDSYEVEFTRQPAASGEGFLMSVSPSEPAAESIRGWMFNGEVAKMFKAAKDGGSATSEQTPPPQLVGQDAAPSTSTIDGSEPDAAQSGEEDVKRAGQPTPFSGITIGMDYASARSRLIRSGYSPAANLGPEEERCGSRGECSTYPETLACSETGLGYCKFAFAQGDRYLIVVTVGEEPQIDHIGWASESDLEDIQSRQ